MSLGKKILIISYYFPPAGGGGVQRIAKFVKYLSKNNWTSIILTATHKDYLEIDIDLYHEIKNIAKVIRVPSPLSKRRTFHIRNNTNTNYPWEIPPHRSWKSLIPKLIRDYFLIPDSQILWVFRYLIYMNKLLKCHRPDIIFVTAPPFSAFILGVLIKLLTKKKLVLDYRDPWTQLFESYRSQESIYRKYIERCLEIVTLKTADRIITTTPEISEYLNTLSVHNNKISNIYNGYDPNDYVNIKKKNFSKFTFVYTGKITPNEYSAVPFLQGLNHALKKYPHINKHMKVIFIGSFNDPSAIKIIKEKNMENIIEIKGYINHKEMLSYQMGADVLLLLLTKGFTDRYIINGKLFEYLKSKRPIMAIIPTTSPMTNIIQN